MAITADSVVVSLEAKTDQYNAKVDQAAKKFEDAMGRTSNAADKAAADAEKAARKKAEAEEAAARRIAEAAEKSRIRLEEAAKKAGLTAEREAQRKADREEAAANRASEAAERAAEREKIAAEKARVAAESAAQKKAQADEAASSRAAVAAENAAAKQAAAAQKSAAAAMAAAQRRAAADEAAAQRKQAAEERASAIEAEIAAKSEAIARRRSRLFNQVAGETYVNQLQNQAAGVEKASARAQNATRNLGRQVSDIGTGLATGQNPFFIIAQQSGQVADALADTGGKAAKVAAFFAGPWGAALLAAGSALGVILGKALETGESVESLTKQLEDTAMKSRLSAQAQEIFGNSLYGAADASAKLVKQLREQNQSQLQVAQSAIAAAAAVRQQNLQNLRAEVSKRALIASEARANANPLNFTGSTIAGVAGASQALAQARTRKELAQADERLAVARKGLADANAAVVEANVPLIKLQAADLSDKSAAATTRHTKAVDRLTDAFRRGKLTVGQYRDAVANADRTLASDQQGIRDANKKGPRGSLGAASGRGAEALRLRQVRNDDAFEQEKTNLDAAILSASGKQAKGIEDQAEAAIASAASENEKRKRGYQNQVNEGRITEAQRAELDARSNGVAILQVVTANLEKQAALARQQAQIAIDAKDAQIAALQAQQAVTLSRAARKRLDDEIIAAKYEERRLQLEANIQQAQANKDAAAEAKARGDLANLPAERRAEQFQSDRNARNPYQVYRDNLNDADSLADEIDNVKIDSLNRITDELTNATKAALGLKGAFGDIVGELIRIGIQRKILGPLADNLFGKADGSTGGAFGSLLGSLFGKRASGGNVVAGQIYHINESGANKEFFQPAQSGKIYPTGSLQARGGGGGHTTVINQSFTLDARYGVTTPQLLQHVNDVASAKAAQAGQAAYQRSPSRVQQYQTLGT